VGTLRPLFMLIGSRSIEFVGCIFEKRYWTNEHPSSLPSSPLSLFFFASGADPTVARVTVAGHVGSEPIPREIEGRGRGG